MPGFVGLAPMPRKRGLLSLRAVNSLKKVFGAYIDASLMLRIPAFSIVSFDTAVTLTGSFCGSSGSFCAVTVIVGSVVRSGGAGDGDGCCAAAPAGEKSAAMRLHAATAAA